MYEVRSTKYEGGAAFVLQTSDFVLLPFLISRKLASGRSIRAVAEEVVGLHEFVNLAGPFVDHRGLAVAEEPSDRVLVGVAVGAVDLDGVARRLLGGDGGEP